MGLNSSKSWQTTLLRMSGWVLVMTKTHPKFDAKLVFYIQTRGNTDTTV